MLGTPQRVHRQAARLLLTGVRRLERLASQANSCTTAVAGYGDWASYVGAAGAELFSTNNLGLVRRLRRYTNATAPKLRAHVVRVCTR